MRIALYEPDMPSNTGTLLRLAACLGVAVDIIEPCGFPFGTRALRRAGMDYLGQADMTTHASWAVFQAALAPPARLILLTTRGPVAYTDFHFLPEDVLLLGRESAGVPDSVHDAADARLSIPLKPGVRSLNVAVAGAMVVGEALRQTAQFPQTA